jgi:hypothetical protein
MQRPAFEPRMGRYDNSPGQVNGSDRRPGLDGPTTVPRVHSWLQRALNAERERGYYRFIMVDLATVAKPSSLMQTIRVTIKILRCAPARPLVDRPLDRTGRPPYSHVPSVRSLSLSAFLPADAGEPNVATNQLYCVVAAWGERQGIVPAEGHFQDRARQLTPSAFGRAVL